MIESVPAPVPHGLLPVDVDADSHRFWDGLADGRLILSACSRCHRVWTPPSPRCPRCGSGEPADREVPGTGHVYSWVVIRRALDPAFADDVPYAIAVVTLDDADGARLLGRILDTPPELIRADLRVRTVTYRVDGQVLPAFMPSLTDDPAPATLTSKEVGS